MCVCVCLTPAGVGCRGCAPAWRGGELRFCASQLHSCASQFALLLRRGFRWSACEHAEHQLLVAPAEHQRISFPIRASMLFHAEHQLPSEHQLACRASASSCACLIKVLSFLQTKTNHDCKRIESSDDMRGCCHLELGCMLAAVDVGTFDALPLLLRLLHPQRFPL